MATYKYPRGQDVIFSAFFVMASDFDSGKYDKYIIRERTSGHTYTFSHERISRYLENNPGDRDARVGFANGKPFIRLRLALAEKDE